MSTPAFPLAVSLPVDLSFEDNGNGWCIVLDISSPTAILFSEVVDALTLRQGPFDGVGPFSPGLQTGTGPLTICNPIGGGRIRLEEVAWDDPRLGEICIDDHHMRRSTGDVACPDDSVCEMRLGAVPVCRRATGPCAGNGCLGTCVEDDGDRSCSPIVVDPSTDRRCLGNLFQVQQPVVDPLLIVCSERCEEFIGCVVGPGGSCRADEQCVSPEDGDALGPCPSSGTCPG